MTETRVLESIDGPHAFYRVRVGTLLGNPDERSTGEEHSVPGEEMSAALASALEEVGRVEGVVGSAGRGGIAVAFWVAADSVGEATSRALEYYARAREHVRGAGMPVPPSSRLEVVSETDFDRHEGERVDESASASDADTRCASGISGMASDTGRSSRGQHGGLVRLAEVQGILGANSRQRASQITRNLDFPEPVQTFNRGRLWDRGEIEGYAAKRAQRRREDAPEK